MSRSGSCAHTNVSAGCVPRKSTEVVIVVVIASPSVSHRAACADHRVAQCVGLAGDERHEQLLLVRETAIHGGPGTAGRAGDIVQRGLGEPDPGDTGRGGVEDLRIAFGLRSATGEFIA